MKFTAAAVCSLAFIFAWAACVASGALSIGTGIEPTVYAISAGLPVVLVVCGIIEEVLFQVWFRKSLASIVTVRT